MVISSDSSAVRSSEVIALGLYISSIGGIARSSMPRGWWWPPSQYQGQVLRRCNPFQFGCGWRVMWSCLGRLLHSGHWWRDSFGEETLFEEVVAMGSFLTPSHISFFILNKLSSSTTGTRHSWSSCTTPQNTSGGLWPEWYTTGVQWPVQQFPPPAPPSSPGSIWHLLGPDILSFPVLPGRVGWSGCHVLPSGQLAGGRPHLDSKLYFWPECSDNTHPWSGLEGKIPPTTLRACYPSPNKHGPTDWGCWGWHQSLLTTSFLSGKGDCGMQQRY